MFLKVVFLILCKKQVFYAQGGILETESDICLGLCGIFVVLMFVTFQCGIQGSVMSSKLI